MQKNLTNIQNCAGTLLIKNSKVPLVIRKYLLITGGTQLNAKIIRDLLDKSQKNLNESMNLYISNPDCDFTRNRKLPFEKVISSILGMEGRSLNNELLYQFGCAMETPTSSAFIQQRSKINYKAFEYLFHDFTTMAMKDNIQLFKGYRLLAVDGSDIQIASNPTDYESHVHGKEGSKPYNLLHLDAMYDLLSNTYVDALACKFRSMNEKGALADMVDRADNPYPAIVIADRGYESYNVLAHIQEKNWKFLIRVKDFGNYNSGIIHGLDLPNENEFDVDIDLNLTYKQTNEAKELLKDRNHYKLLKSNRRFDYLPSKNKKHETFKMYNLKFRVVRFKIFEDSYEVILTNLDKETFPPVIIKELYGKRWGIETSFRNLKYTVGLLHFHSKKVEFIFQEIYARLIMYNYFELIISKTVIQKKQRKHVYMINFSVAAHICREFFLKRIPPDDIEALISRYLTPVRPDRSRPRKMSPKAPISFLYRVA